MHSKQNKSKQVRSSHRSDLKLKIIHGNFFYAVEWVILISRFLRPNTGKLGQIPVEIFRFLNSICHNLTSQFDTKRFQVMHGQLPNLGSSKLSQSWICKTIDRFFTMMHDCHFWLAMNLPNQHHNSKSVPFISAIAFLWSNSMSSFKLSRDSAIVFYLLNSFTSLSKLHHSNFRKAVKQDISHFSKTFPQSRFEVSPPANQFHQMTIFLEWSKMHEIAYS